MLKLWYQSLMISAHFSQCIYFVIKVIYVFSIILTSLFFNSFQYILKMKRPLESIFFKLNKTNTFLKLDKYFRWLILKVFFLKHQWLVIKKFFIWNHFVDLINHFLNFGLLLCPNVLQSRFNLKKTNLFIQVILSKLTMLSPKIILISLTRLF